MAGMLSRAALVLDVFFFKILKYRAKVLFHGVEMYVLKDISSPYPIPLQVARPIRLPCTGGEEVRIEQRRALVITKRAHPGIGQTPPRLL